MLPLRAAGKPNAEPQANVGFSSPHEIYPFPQPLAKKICCAKIFCEEEERAFSAYCPALPNSRTLRSVPTTSVRGKKCERVINFCARKVAFRRRPTFAHTCAFAERVSRRGLYCCENSGGERKPIVRRSRAMGFLFNSRDFFLSVQKEICELFMIFSDSR